MFSHHRKNTCGWRWVYTMENKDINTDSQIIVRVMYQKKQTIEITTRIIFFVWDVTHYFSYREFSSPIWKSPPPKVAIPTVNPNFTLVPPIQTFWNMASPSPHPISPSMGRGRCKLWVHAMAGHIIAVSCMQQLHTWGCPFSKCFQILYIFAQIFKYFAFFVLFLKKSHACPFFLE